MFYNKQYQPEFQTNIVLSEQNWKAFSTYIYHHN